MKLLRRLSPFLIKEEKMSSVSVYRRGSGKIESRQLGSLVIGELGSV
jgi:hypothetical protein